MEYTARANDNLYRGWRFVGGEDQEIWRSASNEEEVHFSYDPATGRPQSFDGSRTYGSKEYYVNWDGREPALQEEKGASHLNIQWNGDGDVVSLNATNLRTDVKAGEERAEMVNLQRNPEGTTYSEEVARPTP